MRRLTGIFGGTNVGPLGGGFDAGSWETNTLVSDTTTVICLDDYHLSDHPASSDRSVFSREFCLKM
jgi:phosphoribulokinase